MVFIPYDAKIIDQSEDVFLEFPIYVISAAVLVAVVKSHLLIGVRAGGARGGCSPPKFWATQIFWAARENLGKASF